MLDRMSASAPAPEMRMSKHRSKVLGHFLEGPVVAEPLPRFRRPTRYTSLAHGQAIAISVHFANEFWRVRSVLDLLAQTGDRDVHGPGRGVFRSPDVPEQ